MTVSRGLIATDFAESLTVCVCVLSPIMIKSYRSMAQFPQFQT